MSHRTMSQTSSETMKRLKTTQILDNICELNDKQRQLHATQNDWQLDTNRLVTKVSHEKDRTFQVARNKTTQLRKPNSWLV
jgi:hypothetical protein